MMATENEKLITSDDPQGRHAIKYIFEKAYNDARLTKDGAQTINEKSSKLYAKILIALEEYARPGYADEETPPHYYETAKFGAYPHKYRGPKKIENQIRKVGKFFDLQTDEALDFAKNVLPTLALPEGAEGWFAVPSFEAIARKLFPNLANLSEEERYADVTNWAFKKFMSSRYSCTYRCVEFCSENLQVTKRTAKAMKDISFLQTADIMIIPAQFGVRHRGKSPRRVRAIYAENEFGMGYLSTIAMMVTHPERLDKWIQLTIACPGDKLDRYNGKWRSIPGFGVKTDGMVTDGGMQTDNNGSAAGHVTGFNFSI